jgi:hypothetical protein
LKQATDTENRTLESGSASADHRNPARQRQNLLSSVLFRSRSHDAKIVNNLANDMLINPNNLGLRPAAAGAAPSSAASQPPPAASPAASAAQSNGCAEAANAPASPAASPKK